MLCVLLGKLFMRAPLLNITAAEDLEVFVEVLCRSVSTSLCSLCPQPSYRVWDTFKLAFLYALRIETLYCIVFHSAPAFLCGRGWQEVGYWNDFTVTVSNESLSSCIEEARTNGAEEKEKKKRVRLSLIVGRPL